MKYRLLLLMVLAVSFLSEQKTDALVLSPSFSDVELLPGDKRVISVGIQNDESAAVIVSPRIKNIRFTQEGIPQLLEDAEVEFSISSWFSLTDQSFELTPGSDITFDVSISPPAGTPAGGYYAGVVMTAVPADSDTGLYNVAIRSELVHVIYLTVAGDQIKGQVQITGFDSTRDIFQYTPVGFRVELKNTGNIHERPFGRIVVTSDITGKRYNEMLINDDLRYVLPGQSKTFEAQWQPNNAEKQLPLMAGKYTAQLTMSGTDVVETVSFIVVPYVAIAFVFIVIIVFIAFLFWYRRRILSRLAQ